MTDPYTSHLRSFGVPSPMDSVEAPHPVNSTDRPGWDEYFLGIVDAVRARADCRRARHGCVIVKDNRIVATGYNGAVSGGPSCLAGECPRGLLSPEQQAHLTPDYSNCVALHAEMGAVAYASRKDTEGSTAYISGSPCDMCGKLLLAAGIVRVVTPTSELVATPKGWKDV